MININGQGLQRRYSNGYSSNLKTDSEKLADKNKILKEKKDLKIWEERLIKENNKGGISTEMKAFEDLGILGGSTNNVN